MQDTDYCSPNIVLPSVFPPLQKNCVNKREMHNGMMWQKHFSWAEMRLEAV
jgi:hypothetical protein